MGFRETRGGSCWCCGEEADLLVSFHGTDQYRIGSNQEIIKVCWEVDSGGVIHVEEEEEI
jgi:hypothetical protein